jgi:hypothetical protein
MAAEDAETNDKMLQKNSKDSQNGIRMSVAMTQLIMRGSEPVTIHSPKDTSIKSEHWVGTASGFSGASPAD